MSSPAEVVDVEEAEFRCPRCGTDEVHGRPAETPGKVRFSCDPASDTAIVSLVLRPEFTGLFARAELDEARRRLDQYGYTA